MSLTDNEKALEVLKALTMEEKKALDDYEKWRFRVNSTLLAISVTMLTVNVSIGAIGASRVDNLPILAHNALVVNGTLNMAALFLLLAWVANILCILALFALVYEHIYVNTRYVEGIRKEKQKKIYELAEAYEREGVLLFLKRLKIFSILEKVAYVSFMVFVILLGLKQII